MNSYKTSIKLNESPNRVFSAISENLGNWWGKQTKSKLKQGTVFKVSWGEPWYKFKVIKFTKNVAMVWECVDANQIIDGLDGVEKEWVGTKIHWNLKPLENRNVILEFEHEGLIPEFICFNFCSKAWTHFLENSLVNYLSVKEK
jgi:hypothetical protein